MRKQAIKVKLYTIIERAVAEGAMLGWRRAYKHSNVMPDDEVEARVVDSIVNEIMNSLCEVINFEDDV